MSGLFYPVRCYLDWMNRFYDAHNITNQQLCWFIGFMVVWMIYSEYQGHLEKKKERELSPNASEYSRRPQG